MCVCVYVCVFYFLLPMCKKKILFSSFYLFTTTGGGCCYYFKSPYFKDDNLQKCFRTNGTKMILFHTKIRNRNLFLLFFFLLHGFFLSGKIVPADKLFKKSSGVVGTGTQQSFPLKILLIDVP